MFVNLVVAIYLLNVIVKFTKILLKNMKLAVKRWELYWLMNGVNLFNLFFFSVVSDIFLFLNSGVRPFGVSLLICGWDDDRPYLFQCDPSVSYNFTMLLFTVKDSCLRGLFGTGIRANNKWMKYLKIHNIIISTLFNKRWLQNEIAW